MDKCPVDSTYYSDPLATHTVEGKDTRVNGHGSGILGYFTSEFDAQRVARYYRENGASHISVEPYNPTAPVIPGIHPLVLSNVLGY